MRTAYLNKRILREIRVNTEATGAYASIMSLLGEGKVENCYLSEEMLCFQLFGNVFFNEDDMKRVQEGLLQLERYKLISREDCTKNGAVFDLATLEVNLMEEYFANEQQYVQIDIEEIRKIFNNDLMGDKWRLFQVYLAWLNNMKRVTLTGFFSGEHHRMELGTLAPECQTQYSDVLETLGLICVCDRRKEKIYYCREHEFIEKYQRENYEYILDSYL